MAEAAMDANKAKKGGGLMKMLMGLLFAAAVGGGGGWYYFTQMAPVEAADAEAEKRAPPIYWSFEPSFVINLPDGAYMRYLKVDLALMTRDAKLPAALEQHTPLLRNELLMLFSNAEYERLLSAEGKEALRAEAISSLNARLVELGAAEGGIENLYFTSFVMQ